MISEILQIDPYSLNKEQKSVLLDVALGELTLFHYQNCDHYRKMLKAINFDINLVHSYYNLPFLPVRLFKMHDLYSIPKEEIQKTMTSSGTTGQTVSKIYIDKETSFNQSKGLAKIVTSFLGGQRAPMIIIDSPSVLKNRNMFSARGAGILGFSIFGTKRIYALNDEMELNIEELSRFIDDNKSRQIFLFGFTFMVYQHFIQELLNKNIKLDLSNGVLIHGGGWKKLQSQSVSSKEFRRNLKELCGIEAVHDYYGMVEQTGSIYMECEAEHLHAPVYADILVRRTFDFSLADFGEPGIIQTLSVLPKSYPGHSLLTEDEGILLGEDDCACGRKGKYFKINGRIQNAEIRGCSDTYADRF